jgi:hypothetical protein
MANRHKAQSKGGRTAYDAAGSNVMSEAKEGTGGHKRGGKVVHAGGSKGKHRFKRGGKVGSDNHPFSSAYVPASGSGK